MPAEQSNQKQHKRQKQKQQTTASLHAEQRNRKKKSFWIHTNESKISNLLLVFNIVSIFARFNSETKQNKIKKKRERRE